MDTGDCYFLVIADEAWNEDRTLEYKPFRNRNIAEIFNIATAKAIEEATNNSDNVHCESGYLIYPFYFCGASFESLNVQAIRELQDGTSTAILDCRTLAGENRDSIERVLSKFGKRGKAAFLINVTDECKQLVRNCDIKVNMVFREDVFIALLYMRLASYKPARLADRGFGRDGN